MENMKGHEPDSLSALGNEVHIWMLEDKAHNQHGSIIGASGDPRRVSAINRINIDSLQLQQGGRAKWGQHLTRLAGWWKTEIERKGSKKERQTERKKERKKIKKKKERKETESKKIEGKHAGKIKLRIKKTKEERKEAMKEEEKDARNYSISKTSQVDC